MALKILFGHGSTYCDNFMFLGRLLSFSLQVQPMEEEPILLLMPAIQLMMHTPYQTAMGESIFMLYEYLQESTRVDVQD